VCRSAARHAEIDVVVCVASDRGLLLIEGKALLYLKAGSPAHAAEIDHQVSNR